MAYKYFTIYWTCFIFFILFWEFSNATLPNWCKDPMPIENFVESLQTGMTDFGLNGIPVHLCRVGSPFSETMFAIWDGKKSLFNFINKDVTFKMMSGNIFWFAVKKVNQQLFSLVKGKFIEFDDFRKFYSMVEGENPKYLPQNFTIVGLESFEIPRTVYAGVHLTEYDLESEVLLNCTQHAIFSHYMASTNIIDPIEFIFVIETEFGSKKPYLTFRPSEYRSSLYQIHSQVILARSDDVDKYFIILFDTPENALNFASYIGKFAIMEPNGLIIPHILENLLNRRNN